MMINMNAAMQRPSNVPLNVLIATGGLGVLFACLALVDERVRDQFAQIFTGGAPTGEVGSALAQVQQTIAVVMEALRDQSVAYAPLTVFGLAALVLVLFMTRT
jgi:hypothetical protein